MMPAGRYYIGDLCYVIDGERWSEVCDLMFRDFVRGEYGEFTLKCGRRIAIYGTKYGDGTYLSNQGTDHCVDSGTIGCILDSETTRHEYENIDELGSFVEFSEPFETSEEDGVIKFGEVEIDTDPEYDEDDEWSDEDEDEEEDD